MRFWVDGFRRDSHPSKEIAVWERVAAVYKEYVALAPTLDREQHEKIIHCLLAFGAVADENESLRLSEGLPEGAVEILSNLYASPEPVYDIREELSCVDADAPSEEVPERFKEYDKEHFPGDLPEELIRELMGTEGSKPKE